MSPSPRLAPKQVTDRITGAAHRQHLPGHRYGQRDVGPVLRVSRVTGRQGGEHENAVREHRPVGAGLGQDEDRRVPECNDGIQTCPSHPRRASPIDRDKVWQSDVSFYSGSLKYFARVPMPNRYWCGYDDVAADYWFRTDYTTRTTCGNREAARVKRFRDVKIRVFYIIYKIYAGKVMRIKSDKSGFRYPNFGLNIAEFCIVN